jgi:hypothetical protein
MKTKTKKPMAEAASKETNSSQKTKDSPKKDRPSK